MHHVNKLKTNVSSSFIIHIVLHILGKPKRVFSILGAHKSTRRGDQFYLWADAGSYTSGRSCL